MSKQAIQLGVNIDHVATVRNARGGSVPDPIEAALIAETHGADGITAHLREDRRHFRDDDLARLRQVLKTRLNLEMANTPEMVRIALDHRPTMVTLVPERREEVTTEGGLDVVRYFEPLQQSIAVLQAGGIEVSLFIDPDSAQVAASHAVGARVVELHTGVYCEAFIEQHGVESALEALMQAARHCEDFGLTVNAGHGLNYENVTPILALPRLVELNIGHSIVAEAIFSGFGPAVRRMKDLLHQP